MTDRFDEEARRLMGAPLLRDAIAAALRAAFDAGKADEADETACWRAKAADRVAALTEVADERDRLRAELEAARAVVEAASSFAAKQNSGRLDALDAALARYDAARRREG